jgi:hypothetical protein
LHYYIQNAFTYWTYLVSGIFDVEVKQPADLARVQNAPVGERRAVIGINNAPPTVQAAVTRSDRFKELSDLAENRRLHMALMNNFNT